MSIDNRQAGISLDLTQTTSQVVVGLQDAGTVAFGISGLTGKGATLVVECTIDESIWLPLAVAPAITTNGHYRFDDVGFTSVRLRVSIAGTGSATVAYNASAAVDSVQGSQPLPAGSNVVGAFQLADGTTPSQRATITLFHASDNQNPGGAGYGLLTGGVAQLLNPAGNIDRQRETGFDNIPAAGVATGTQQLAGPPLTTTVASGAITASASPQTVTLGSVSWTNRGVTSAYQAGTTLSVDSGGSQEYVYLTAVSGNTVTGVFARSHAAGVAVAAFAYNQARDATIPDGSSPAGISAGGAYLYNAAGTGSVEFERSFAGELMGARGTGAAIAAEYEDTSGGPPLASGVASGMRLMPAQALMGVGLSSAAITATTAGASTLAFASAAATNALPAGHALQLSGGAAVETVFTSIAWVPGSSSSVPLQSPVVNAAQTAAAWSAYAANGPGLSGFLPHGIGVEEEAVYDPVTGLLYIERSATQDGVSARNVVLENPGLWNGATIDRARGVVGDAQAGTGIQAVIGHLWNGASYDRQPGTTANGAKVSSAPAQLAVADPDIATVTTGGTAVAAFSAGHVAKGGVIKNPVAATAPLYVRLTGTAGTTETGGTISIAPGQTYTIPPMAGAVSVNATDSGHVFCGMGFQ